MAIICDYIRTPFTKIGGIQANFGIKKMCDNLLSSYSDKEIQIDILSFLCTLTAGQGYNLASQISNELISNGVERFSLNDGAFSAVRSIQIIDRMIGTQKKPFVGIILGAENISNSPKLLFNSIPNKSVQSILKDYFIDPTTKKHRLILAEEIINTYGIKRKQLDKYAIQSNRKTLLQFAQNKIQNQIKFLQYSSQGNIQFKITDDALVEDSSNKITKAEPLSKEKGTLTSFTSAQLADGAASFLLSNLSGIKKFKLNALAKVKDIAVHYTHEDQNYIDAGIQSTAKLLNSNGLYIEDIDHFDIHVDYAITPIKYGMDLDIPNSKLNTIEDSITTGNPLSASGVRLLGLLASKISKKKKRYGVACFCDITGKGVSVLLERFKS